MKNYLCDSDIGSVLIGDENWTFAVPNEGGDGTTTLYVYDSEYEFKPHSDGFTFVSSVQGKFGVFDHDCAFRRLLDGRMTMNDAVCVLNGRYGVYSGDFSVALVKWEDYDNEKRGKK